jgi:hypothetical protein
METIELYAVTQENIESVKSIEKFSASGDGIPFKFGDRFAYANGEHSIAGKVVYCHIKRNAQGILTQLFVTSDVDWYFQRARVYDWIYFNQYNKKKNFNYFKQGEMEDDEMFENYVITDIEFGELNLVALKTSMKAIVKELEGVELVKEASETYLVKDGNAVKIDSDEFQGQVKKYVVGKTMAELKKNAAMYKIITKLGLISKCSLEKNEDGLAGIFG